MYAFPQIDRLMSLVSTVLSFKKLHAWMLAHKVPVITPFSSQIAVTSTAFPMPFIANMSNITKVYSSSDDMINVLCLYDIVGDDIFKNLEGALRSLAYVVILFKYTPETETAKATNYLPEYTETVEEHTKLITEWKRLDVKNKVKNVKFEEKLELLFDGISKLLDIGGVSPFTKEWCGVMKAEINSMNNASDRFLKIENYVKEKTGGGSDETKKIVKGTELKKLKTLAHYSFGKTHAMTVETDGGIIPPSTAPQLQKSSGGGVEVDAPSTGMTEYELHTLNDPLSRFFLLSCGEIAWSMLSIFTMLPPKTSSSFRYASNIDAYFTCLKPIAVMAYTKTNMYVVKFSKRVLGSELRLVDYIMLGEYNQFVILASRLCGFYLRSAEISKPQRNNRTHVSILEDQRCLNNIHVEMINELKWNRMLYSSIRLYRD